MRENFSFEMLTDPKKFFEDIVLDMLIFLIKICIFGYIIYYTMKKTQLTDDHSIINYVKYLVGGSIVLYIVSILNMIYDCYMAGTELEKMSFMKLAKSSLFAVVFIFVHIIVLIVCSILKFTPEVGIIVNELAWGTMYIVLITGLVYRITYDSVQLAVGCPSN
jgi:hypothetical protein